MDLLCWLVGHNEVLDAKFEGFQSFAHEGLLNAPSSEHNFKLLTEIDIVVQHGEASWNHGNLTLMSCDEALASDLEVFLDMFRFVRAHTANGFYPLSFKPTII